VELLREQVILVQGTGLIVLLFFLRGLPTDSAKKGVRTGPTNVLIVQTCFSPLLIAIIVDIDQGPSIPADPTDSSVIVKVVLNFRDLLMDRD